MRSNLLRGTTVVTLLWLGSVGAETIEGRLPCGPYRVTRPSSPSGTFTAELCEPKIRVEGTYSGDQLQATRIQLSGLARPVDLRSVRLPAFDVRSSTELERFLAPLEAIRLADALTRQASPDTSDSAGGLATDAAQVILGSGELACTDVENATGSVIDVESAIRASAYVVPPWCLVIAMGPVEVDSLRVEGVLIRVGGKIEAREVRTGSLTGGVLGGVIMAYGVDVARATGSRVVAEGAALLGDLAPGPGLLESEQVHLSSGRILVEGATVSGALVAEKGSFGASGAVRTPVVRAFEGGAIRAGSLEVDRVEARGGAIGAAGVLGGRQAPPVIDLQGGSVSAGSATVASVTIAGGRLEVSGGLSTPILSARNGSVSAGEAEIDLLVLEQGSGLGAEGYLGPKKERAVQAGEARVTDSNLSGGSVRYAKISVLRGGASATGSFDLQELIGAEARVHAGEALRARTGPGRVEIDRGSLRVEGALVAGAPGFESCALHAPQVDVTTLIAKEAPVDATHLRADTARIEGGHLWMSDLTSPFQCVEIASSSHFDGVAPEPFLKAPRIYAAVGRSTFTQRTIVELLPAGEGSEERWVKTPSGEEPDASGASFGGFGGTSASLNVNSFVPAEQPGARPALGRVDSPLEFRETGVGGFGKKGGIGGGALRVRGTSLTFDGLAHADGTDGKAAAGGGSGGTIALELTGDLSGRGTFRVNGGRGGYGGSFLAAGGGSAGRIKIAARGKSGWRGRTETSGGLGADDREANEEVRRISAWDDWRNHGGPGTVYWELSAAPDELVIEGPLDGDAHRGVSLVSGAYPDAIVRIRNAVVATDGLSARGLQLEEGGVLRPNNPRLRIDFPARHERFPYKPKDGKPSLSSVQAIYPKDVWDDELGEKLRIELSGDLVVARGGRLDVTALGGPYLEGVSLGAINVSGGSHAGQGGIGRQGNPNSFGRPEDTYGEVLEPTEVGRGGFGHGAFYPRKAPVRTTGLGGIGGGALRLIVGGTARIDGAVRADGDAGATPAPVYHERGSGGGAGGSLWLSARGLEGAGVISASGGDGTADVPHKLYGGGGGGGRIRIDLEKPSSGWRGQVLATGGAGGRFTAAAASRPLLKGEGPRSYPAWSDARLDGGAGTILWNVAGAGPRLEIANAAGRGGVTRLPAALEGHSARVSAAHVVATHLKLRTLELVSGARLTADDQRAWLHPAVGRAPGGWLPVTLWLPPSEGRLELAVGSLKIDRTSAIEVSGLGGWSAEYESCQRAHQNRAGGSHGGRGGTGVGGHPREVGCPRAPIGAAERPALVGPGGFGSDTVDGANNFTACKAGGSGGGALRVTAERIQLDGRIAADGASGGDAKVCPAVEAYGGGAGGSVWLSAEELQGRGSVSANGAPGVVDGRPPVLGKGGGGSGGRVHVEARRCKVTASVVGGGPRGFEGEPGSALGPCKASPGRGSSAPRLAGERRGGGG